MKFYSEILNKLYNTEKELQREELSYIINQKEKEKAARFQEVEAARSKYFKLKEKFEQDYNCSIAQSPTTVSTTPTVRRPIFGVGQSILESYINK